MQQSLQFQVRPSRHRAHAAAESAAAPRGGPESMRCRYCLHDITEAEAEAEAEAVAAAYSERPL
jgi:hypothetical protein